MKNKEIRRTVKNKMKGKLKKISFGIFLITLVITLLFLPFGYLLEIFKKNMFSEVSSLIELIIQLACNNLILWLSITLGLKFLKNEENIKLFSPLKKIKKCFKFLGLNILLILKLSGWLLLTFIPIFIIGFVDRYIKIISPKLFISVYSILIIIFLIYKILSYTFSIFLCVDIEEISYTKAIKMSISMMKDEKFKFIRFNITNMFLIGVIPTLLFIFSMALIINIPIYMLDIDAIMIAMPNTGLKLMGIGLVYVLYNVLVAVPYCLIMNLEYYLQLKENKKI